MKSKPTKSAAAGSKNKVKKTPEGVSGPTLSRKLRDNKNGETSKSGTALKSAGVQKRGWDGSILHYIYKSTLGQSLHSQMSQCHQEPFVRSLSSYHFHGASSPFDRRITCLEWHPTHPITLAVGSKGGDIYLWDFEAPAKKTFIQGINKFNPMGDAIGSDMGITVLVWDRNESLMSDHHVQQEGPSTSVLRGQRRSQPRSSRNRRGPAVDVKLKKKLASLEETETKTKDGCTKQKQTQMRKK